jgi:hypothetical protein
MSAETAGAISRDHLKAAIATLTVLTPHVIVGTAKALLEQAFDRNGRPVAADESETHAARAASPAEGRSMLLRSLGRLIGSEGVSRS